MQALVLHGERDLRLVEWPVDGPGPGEVTVRIRAGGICGSDLHYYRHGGFGTVRLREPMVLGHEVAGVVEGVGSGVTNVVVGERVTVNPSFPCNRCRYCLAGQQNHCLDMRFYGSAMRFPHVQGAFRELLVCDASQVHAVVDEVSDEEAAMAEPLAVVLHASQRAGNLTGKRVLITGCGPIGSLAVLIACLSGAAEIVATDIAEAPLAFARRVGADCTINVARDEGALSAFAADKGYFDLLFEASGSEHALRNALEVVRPGARAVQIGLGGSMNLPINMIVAKELQIIGTFRFHAEFALAVEMLNRRRVDVKPFLTRTFPLDRAREAFDLAGDRSRAQKVQISFAPSRSALASLAPPVVDAP